jgi:hypothetical protein
MRTLIGKLFYHYETGLEGGQPALDVDDSSELCFLQKGDYLTVYSNGKIHWEGKITKRMAEIYLNKPHLIKYRTGYRNKKWVNMFVEEMCAELKRQD